MPQEPAPQPGRDDLPPGAAREPAPGLGTGTGGGGRYGVAERASGGYAAFERYRPFGQFEQDQPLDTEVASAALAVVLDELAGADRRPAAASDDAVVGMLGGFDKLAGWAEAGRLGLIRELIRRRALPGQEGRGPGGLPGAWEPGVAQEVAVQLSISARAADTLIGTAYALARLPGVAAALEAGIISGHKAAIIAEATSPLTDQQAAEADRRAAPRLGGKTPGQVRELIRRIVLAVDPEGARRRREEAQREHARVELWQYQVNGTANLAGFGLPPDEALIANQRIQDRALAYKRAGVVPGAAMDLLRVRAYIDLLLGRDPRNTPPTGPADANPADAGAADGGAPDSAEPDSGAAGSKAAAERTGAADPSGENSHSDGQGADTASGQPAGADPGTRRSGNGPGTGTDSDPQAGGTSQTGSSGPGGGHGRPGTGQNSGPGTGQNSSPGTGQNSSPGTGQNSSPGTGQNSSPGTGQNSSLAPGDRRSPGTGDNGSPGAGGTGPATGGTGPADGGAPAGMAAAGSGTGTGTGTGTGPGLAANVNLTIPLATLLGLAERPGQLAGLGPIDPALARDLATAAAHSDRSAWCVTITNPDGHAIGHGCARPARTSNGKRGKPGPAGTGRGTRTRAGPAFTPAGDGPPGGYGTWTLTTASGQDLTVKVGPVPVTDCDHRYETAGYQPSGLLRHLVQIRDGTCTFPPCRRPAKACDFEHATPYHLGGRTDLCNCGPRCRRDHQVKQSNGWTVTQDQPGYHQWQTPAGRRYTTGPTEHPT